MDKIVTRFKKQVWLNDDTPSTGSVVCYDGQIIEDDKSEPWESQFIEISDCHSKSRLHRASYDTDKDWLMKVRDLHAVITEYYDHLYEKYKSDHKQPQ